MFHVLSVANAAKLENFVRAADIMAAANLQMSPIVRNRKLQDGMTLFESIASGTDGEKAALSLVNMLRDEAERRNQLTARFAGRKVIAGVGDDAPTIFNDPARREKREHSGETDRCRSSSLSDLAAFFSDGRGGCVRRLQSRPKKPTETRK
jgi:hypothetical protein